ncbi:MAG: succinate dehydrogenase cytochrome b subunit [Bacteroidetes bacterium]|nr:succinate dehydrogenase cytochrome b subunit [Bacteroidota bacterium]
MSSLTKKYIMGLTGLFLIIFLVVHAGVNALIYLNDGGETFLVAAHFMGSNILVRTLEIGLVAGFLIHIYDGLMLWYQNKQARPQDYAYSKASANSTWYSRSMGLLGTLLLFFLIIHTADFWIPNRTNQFVTGEELNLFVKMKAEFQETFVVIVYLLGCFSLFWHLLHGFKSAFQTLGINHKKYNGFIQSFGTAFSVIIPCLFASMPLSFYFGIIK